MYSPYLKGKQFEFLALRELSETFSKEKKDNVLPIVEPVKRSTRDASNAFKAMIESRWKFALILNPHLGDFQRGDNNYFNIIHSALGQNQDSWIPAYILNKSDNINGMINEAHWNIVMVVLPKDEEIDYWEQLLKLDIVKYIVICNADSTSVLRKLRRLGHDKVLIRLDDCFQAESKNALYADKEDQFFNDNHAVYTEDGLTGFADYTTLPSKFIEGGVSPTVVAIHLTYRKTEEEIRVRHFLSDTNAKTNANVQGKFLESASQIEAFFNNYPNDKTEAVSQLIELSRGHYPGLGSIKKYSMKHHITLMSDF